MKTCPLCKRAGEQLEMQAHHLRTRRADKALTEDICRECHKTIHGLFTNKELRDPERGLDTCEGLLEHQAFAKALRHIRKLPPGQYMRMKQAKKR
jgi:hypothetical protein